MQLEPTLGRTLEDVSRDAERTVRDHLAAHGMGGAGEDWISQGLSHSAGKTCPFCGQPTEGLDLIAAFRSFFNEAYRQFRGELERYRNNAARLFADGRIEIIVTQLSGNASGSEVWGRYVAIDRPELPSGAELPGIVATFRNELVAVLDRKLASSLDPVALPATYVAARERFAVTVEAVAACNAQVAAANEAIAAFKQNANPARLQTAERELSGLRLIRKRREPAVRTACDRFTGATGAKSALETEKKAVRTQLDTYGKTVMERYKNASNAYLKKFTAGFRIDRVKIEYTGRVPNSTFCIVINETPVDLGNPDTPLDQPSFRNTLPPATAARLRWRSFSPSWPATLKRRTASSCSTIRSTARISSGAPAPSEKSGAAARTWRRSSSCRTIAAS